MGAKDALALAIRPDIKGYRRGLRAGATGLPPRPLSPSVRPSVRGLGDRLACARPGWTFRMGLCTAWPLYTMLEDTPYNGRSKERSRVLKEM